MLPAPSHVRPSNLSMALDLVAAFRTVPVAQAVSTEMPAALPAIVGDVVDRVTAPSASHRILLT